MPQTTYRIESESSERNTIYRARASPPRIYLSSAAQTMDSMDVLEVSLDLEIFVY